MSGINTATAQVNDTKSINDEILDIKDITNKVFDEQTDESIYTSILENYSSEDLRLNFVEIVNNNNLTDEEKRNLGENLRFLIEKKSKTENDNAEKQQQQLQLIQDEKHDSHEQAMDEVERLKELLEANNNKIENQNKEITEMKQTIDELRSQLNNRSNDNVITLQNLKKAKTTWDESSVSQLQDEIRKLRAEKKALINKYWWKLPDFWGEIKELKTNMLEFNFLWKINEWWQTKLRIGPEIAIRRNILSRHRINTIVNKLNDLSKELWDPKNPDAKWVKKWVNYILNKSFLLQWWPISSACKATRNILKIRTTAEFDEAFWKQKKIILEDLKAKMGNNTTSTKDDDTIKAVENRFDYYQAAYKRIFIRV